MLRLHHSFVFYLSDNQVEVGVFVDEEWEKEDKAEYDSSRYLIRIEDPLWIDCHLENGFWVISTCEPYSALLDEECQTLLAFVKQILGAFGAHTAYITEELADWLEYSSPEMSLGEWLQKVKDPYVIEG